MSRRTVARRTKVRREGRRARRVRTQNRRGYLILSASAIAVVAVVAGALWLAGHSVELDEVTLCPLNRPPERVVAILVDGSDPVSPIQRALVRTELNAVRRSLPRYAALQVHVLGTAAEEALEPVFRACNPGSPDEIDQLIESPLQARRRWEEGFLAPLEAAFETVLPEGSAPVSPIIESVQAVAASTFVEYDRSVPRTLVVVSDMLQNTENASHYRSTEGFAGLQSQPNYAHLRADLEGVEVEILYVDRPEFVSFQGADHITFWQEYFADQGATLKRVKRIAG